MGIGNRKSEGDKGTSFSYRLKHLRLLQGISNFVGLGATEATLQQVLSAIQDGTDFEAKIVVDDNGNGTTYLEVRLWNTVTKSWEPALYYLPGSNTGVPASSLVAPINYINNGAVLAQIYAELLGQGITLDDILISINDILDTVHLEVDDDAIAVEQELPTNINLLYGAFEGEGTEWERIQTDGDGRLKGIYDLLVELTAINNNTDNVEALLTAIDTVLDNSLIQLQAINVNTDQLEALSTDIKNLLTTIDADTSNLDVLLSTRASEATLALVLAELQAINIDTNGLNQEVTQLLIKGVLDAIKLDTANLDVALSTRATEATLLLIKGILDNIKLDTAAIDANTDGLEALLTTIDAVLDTIKADTALINSNIVLGNITLNTIDAVLDTIKLDTGALVVDLAAIEVLITASNALLTTIDADTGNIATSTANIDTALTPTTRTHNYAVSNGAGSVPAGSMCGSVLNNGSSAGTWNGNALPAGVTVEWSAVGNRDTYGAITFDATGTEFIIEYTT